MSQQHLAHVFSAVITLERCLTDLGEATKKRNDRALAARLAQQSKIVRQMRLVANRLQLDYAAATNGSNSGEVTRTISIFYALNQMVRPEVMKTYAELNRVGNLKNNMNGPVVDKTERPRAELH